MGYVSDLAQRTVDGVFAKYGRPATYTEPGGVPVDCTVIVDLRGDDARPADHRPIKGGRLFEIRKVEIAAPVQAGLIAFDGVTVTVTNRPWTDDEEGLVWKMWAL